MLQPHFLQTKPWETFQNNLGRQTFRGSGNGWQWMAILERGHLGSRLYCPYGPTAKSTEALAEALSELRKKAGEVKVDFIRIEPQAPILQKNLQKHDAIRAIRDIQPARTWQVDLTQPEEAIFSAITSGNRRNYKNAKHYGLSFRASQEPAHIELFLSCIHEVAARTGIRPHSDNYFRTQAETLMPLGAVSLLIAEVNGRTAATALVFDSETARGYAHAAAHYELRKAQPSSALVCFAMIDAKQKGKEIFDFYGVAPPNEPNHRLAGITKFKQSFGGHPVDYLGTWDIPLHKSRYRLYRIANKVTETKRKLRQIRNKSS